MTTHKFEFVLRGIGASWHDWGILARLGHFVVTLALSCLVEHSLWTRGFVHSDQQSYFHFNIHSITGAIKTSTVHCTVDWPGAECVGESLYGCNQMHTIVEWYIKGDDNWTRTQSYEGLRIDGNNSLRRGWRVWTDSSTTIVEECSVEMRRGMWRSIADLG